MCSARTHDDSLILRDVSAITKPGLGDGQRQRPYGELGDLSPVK